MSASTVEKARRRFAQALSDTINQQEEIMSREQQGLSTEAARTLLRAQEQTLKHYQEELSRALKLHC